eukprot:6752562-Prymnesium_polylepis.1
MMRGGTLVRDAAVAAAEAYARGEAPLLVSTSSEPMVDWRCRGAEALEAAAARLRSRRDGMGGMLVDKATELKAAAHQAHTPVAVPSLPPAELAQTVY